VTEALMACAQFGVMLLFWDDDRENEDDRYN